MNISESYKFINGKPTCKVVGHNGNIFNILSLASNTLKKYKMTDQSKEMTDRVTKSHSYNEALMIIGEYVYLN